MKDIQWYQEKYGKGWIRYFNSDKLIEEGKGSKVKYSPSGGNKRKQFWTEEDYYRERVKELTNNNLYHIPNSHKRGFHQYHVDHKISIHFGFENGIPEEQIAHPSNLQMLWWKDNISKNVSNTIDEENRWILIENDLPIQ